MNKVEEVLEKFGLSLQIFKTALAAAVSWFIASNLLKTDFPYFATLAAILTDQVTVADSLEKATQRIIGIVFGVMISMFIGHWLSMGALSIFLVILTGMVIANSFHMNPQIISQVAVSSFLVLAFGNTHGYVGGRIYETVMGSAIAVIINAMIIPRNAIPYIEKDIISLSELSSATLKNLVKLIEDNKKYQMEMFLEVRALVDKMEKTFQASRLAEQSLKYTPFLKKTKARLNDLSKAIIRFEHITVQIRGIRRGLDDLYSDNEFIKEYTDIENLQDTITATAECINQFGKIIVNPSEENMESFNQKIRNAGSAQTNCLSEIHNIKSLMVLRDIGGILTDLNRIIKETQLEFITLSKN